MEIQSLDGKSNVTPPLLLNETIIILYPDIQY